MKYIKKLTDKEMAQIRDVKKKANWILKANRDGIKHELKNLKKYNWILKRKEITRLENRLEELQNITGKPVQISVDGNTVYLNYELLEKLDRALSKQFGHLKLTVRPGVSLTINYQTGEVELYQIPAYHVEILQGLAPTVEL